MGELLLRPANGKYSPKPTGQVYLSRGSVFAVEADTHHLVIADARRSGLSTTNRTKEEVRTVAARLVELAPAPPDRRPGWLAVQALGTVITAPLDPVAGLHPMGAEWAESSMVDSLHLTVDVGRDRWTVAHLRAGFSGTPATAALDLLEMLSFFALRSTVAEQLFRGATSGHLLATVNVVTGETEQLGHDNRSTVVAGSGRALVWRLPEGGGFVVESDARELDPCRSATEEAKGGVRPSSLIHLSDEFLRSRSIVPEPFVGSKISRTSQWDPVPGASVTVSRELWRVAPGDGPGSGRTEALNLIVAAAGVTWEFVGATPQTLDRRLQQLAHATTHAGATRVEVHHRSMAVTWHGSGAAVAATRRRAVDVLGEGDSSKASTREAAALIGSALLSRHTVGMLPADVTDALEVVGVADLEATGFGTQSVAIFVLEEELAKRFAPTEADPADPAVFADALTAYLVAILGSMNETRFWVWQRICKYVMEYLRRQPIANLGPEKIASRDVSGAAELDWETIAEAAPWIRWIAVPESDPPAGLEVTTNQMLDLLSLLRPHQRIEKETPGGDGHIVHLESVPARFGTLFRWPDAEEVTGAALDQLSDAMSHLFQNAAEADRRVQGIDLPSAMADTIAVLTTERNTDGGADELLVVRVDNDQGHRVVLVNLSPAHYLDVRAGSYEIRLRPNAVDRRHAFGYCSPRIRIEQSDVVQIRDRRIDVSLPATPLADYSAVTLARGLPEDLFRGRQTQLEKLGAPIASRGPRVGSLIVGTRRAGKSSLAYRASKIPAAQGSVWLDLSSTPPSVGDFGQWSAAISKALRRAVRNELQLELPLDIDDLVELIVELDGLLDGHGPVVLVLDELDVILLPEQGTHGRHLAGRLGALTLDNIAMIGTAQRFHRSVSEFKTWNMIDCPADLAWSDGVTYFFGPLRNLGGGPRVEHLSRPGLTPRLFSRAVAPTIGLRPYFWAQLRSRLEAGLYAHPERSRLIDIEDVRAELRAVEDEDAHLNSVFDAGEGLDLAERRRRDLFSDDERRILLAFAHLDQTATFLSVAQAAQLGGDEAINELIDRAYLVRSEDGTRLRTAIPLYQSFLRHRVADLAAMTPHARMLAAPQRASIAIARPANVAAISEAVEVVTEIRSDATEPVPFPHVAKQVLGRVPELKNTNWAGEGTFARFVRTHAADLPFGKDGGLRYLLPDGVDPDAPLPAFTPLVIDSPDEAADLESIRSLVLEAVDSGGKVASLTNIGSTIRAVFPDVKVTEFLWCGTLSNFLEIYVPEVERIQDDAGGHVRRRPVG